MVTVPSIDKYLEKVKKAGGKVITGKEEAGEWGYWAEIEDTEGNAYELWEDME
jgi:predicted enzyme related to lactoylglutathione lyase